jgi:hypothetical protein
MPYVTKFPTVSYNGDIAWGDPTQWFEPNNVNASDTAWATNARAADEVSEYLITSHYDFAIPSTATINGIVLRIKKRDPNFRENIYESEVMLRKSSGSIGDNKAYFDEAWSSRNEIDEVDYGSPTDLWNTTWTPTEINNDGFGTQLFLAVASETGNAEIEHIYITVYYTEVLPVGCSPLQLMVGN